MLSIHKKNAQELAVMREAGKRLARIVSELAEMAVPGSKTEELEAHARARLLKLGSEPAFLGYTAKGARGPFPSVLCTSINDELIHAPSLPSRTLHDGDIVSLDFGLRYPSVSTKQGQRATDGRGETSTKSPRHPELVEGSRSSFFVDMAVTVPVGSISPRVDTLLRVTREALDRAIALVRPGVHLRDIARAIQTHVESYGFSVARDYVGHGIGQELHEPPEVPNFISREFVDVILEEGMTIAIEPMVTMGSPALTHGTDGWTAKTKDGSLAAHFEHTIAVTKNCSEILTSFSALPRLRRSA